uniref:Uncharacterized protein n=1 Tax=Sus scrofa TaxID=9823 RepID=A0A8D1ZZ96_PIG
MQLLSSLVVSRICACPEPIKPLNTSGAARRCLGDKVWAPTCRRRRALPAQALAQGLLLPHALARLPSEPLRHSPMGLRTRPRPRPCSPGPTSQRPLPPLCLPEAPCSNSRSGPSSGLNSWLMATPCSLVTSETMIVDLRRSSMCTDCHSPGTQAGESSPLPLPLPVSHEQAAPAQRRRTPPNRDLTPRACSLERVQKPCHPRSRSTTLA